MRTTPLIGGKAWFGPRRLGWGLAPRTPEGWAVVIAGIVVAVLVATLATHARWVAVFVVAALVAVVFLKGTSPGGPRRWEELRSQQDDRGPG